MAATCLADVTSDDSDESPPAWTKKHVLPPEPAKQNALIEMLVKLLDHDDPFVALYAVQRLVIEAPDSPNVAKTLVWNIQNRDDYLAPMASYSGQACSSLGQLKGPAIPVLIDALETEDWYYPALAIARLGEKAKPAFPWIKKKLISENTLERRTALWMVARIGPPAHQFAPMLIERLKSDKESDRECKRWLISALGKLGQSSVDAVPKLISMIAEDEDEKIYSTSIEEMAAEALAEIGDPRAVGPIVKRCEALPDYKTNQLVTSLTKLDAKRSIRFLESLFAKKDVNSGTAYRLINRLGESNSESAAGFLVKLLQQNQDQDKLWLLNRVFLSLAELGPTARRFDRDIEPFLNHDNANVSVAAAVALGSIRGDHRPFFDVYRRNLGSQRPYQWACRGLAKLPQQSLQIQEQICALVRELANDPANRKYSSGALAQPLDLVAKLDRTRELQTLIEELRNHPSSEVRLQSARIRRDWIAQE